MCDRAVGTGHLHVCAILSIKCDLVSSESDYVCEPITRETNVISVRVKIDQ